MSQRIWIFGACPAERVRRFVGTRARGALRAVRVPSARAHSDTFEGGEGSAHGGAPPLRKMKELGKVWLPRDPPPIPLLHTSRI